MERALPPIDPSFTAKPGRPRVFLVRHGETDWNVEGRLAGLADRPLTPRGERQALELGARLRQVPFGAVLASPLQRTRRTAELLVGEHGRDALSIRVDERLVENGFGPYEGWNDDELYADPAARAWREHNTPLPGAEPDESIAARAAALYAELAGLTGNTLVVSHGGLLRMLITTCILGLAPSELRRLRMSNCRPAVVEPGPKPLLLAINA
jgi:broad specificity phosphatase PhoE